MWSNPDIVALPPRDSRIEYIYDIIKHLFQEISFDLYGLLFCQYKTFPIFYVFFTGRLIFLIII